MQKETVFLNSIRTIGKRKNQQYEKTYYRLLALLSKPKRDEHIQFIQGMFFKTLSSKTINSEDHTFKTVLLALEDIDAQAVPFSINSLNEQNFNTIEQKLEATKTFLLDAPALGLEEEYFDFVLNLNNELFKKTESKIENKDKIFISIKSILHSSSNLFSFLSAYKEQDRLLSNFSQLTLTPRFNTSFKSLLKKKYSRWVQIESKLISLQSELYLVDIEINRFKSVLRHFLVRSVIDSDSENNWSTGTFTYAFLSFIQTQTSVQLNKIKGYSQGKTIDFIPDIILGFEVFSSTNPFEKMPEHKRKQWYYRGLFFHYLKFLRIPFWSETNKIEDFEVENFISLLWKQKDGAFLRTLINDSIVRGNLLNIIQSQSVAKQKKFLIQVIEKENQKSFKTFLDQAFNWFKEEGIPSFKLVESLIAIGHWRFKSVSVLVEKLETHFQKEFPRREYLSKELNTFRLENFEEPSISNKSELLLYYLDTKNLPKTIVKEKKTIIPILRKELDENPSLAFMMFSAVLQKSQASNDERLTIFSRKSITQAIIFRYKDTQLDNNLILPFLQELENQIVNEALFLKYIQIFLDHLTKNKEDIRLAIKLTLHHLLSTQNPLSERLINTLTVNSNFEQWMTKKSIENAKKEQQLKDDFDTLLHYVEIGSLPIHQLDISQAQLHTFLENAPLLLAQKHIYIWSKEEEKLERFLKLYEPKSRLLDVLEYVQSDLANLIIEASQIFNRDTINPKKVQKIHIQKAYAKTLLMLWASQNFKVTTPYPLLAKFIKKEFIKERPLLDQFIKLLDNSPDHEIKIDKQKLLRELLPIRAEKKEPQYEIVSEEPLKREELKNGIIIENSGLVIAWPFLTTLFSKMGLIEDNKIKNNVSIQKAILATQYLVHGAKEVDETQLILNKILCGADIDFYVDVDISLDDLEIGICDMALKSILGQWGKIKSVGALREYFFQRAGLIQSNEEGAYTLIVEKETRDILLKFIPWNLSIIKTTLMNDKIIIDWKYL